MILNLFMNSDRIVDQPVASPGLLNRKCYNFLVSKDFRGNCSEGSLMPGAEDGRVPHSTFSRVEPAGANTGHTAGTAFMGGRVDLKC